jgi:mitotic spindle assembly checkpoint protein MAD2B
MGPLPVPGCGFTVAVELKDDEEEEEKAKAPIGSGQVWIPSEPGLQPRSSRGGSRTRDGEDLGGVKTRAVRKVEAGPLWFECWVEESRAKEELELARREEGAEKKGGG